MNTLVLAELNSIINICMVSQNLQHKMAAVDFGITIAGLTRPQFNMMLQNALNRVDHG